MRPKCEVTQLFGKQARKRSKKAFSLLLLQDQHTQKRTLFWFEFLHFCFKLELLHETPTREAYTKIHIHFTKKSNVSAQPLLGVLWPVSNILIGKDVFFFAVTASAAILLEEGITTFYFSYFFTESIAAIVETAPA